MFKMSFAYWWNEGSFILVDISNENISTLASYLCVVLNILISWLIPVVYGAFWFEFINSVTDTNFLCNDCVIQGKNGCPLSNLRVEFPHTWRRNQILVHFWNSRDISTEKELVKWVVLFDWSICGVEQRWKQIPV